ncbi:MAG TPA: hypothetical protein VF676_12745 [Flavobacterium sp.]|jgi:hypothetical protein
MIPKTFKDTLALIRDYNDAVEAKVGNLDRMTPEDEIYSEMMVNSKSGKVWLDDISETFDREYKKYNKLNIYFPGCSSDVYERTFLGRMKNYLEANEDSSELTFLFEELTQNYVYSISDYISEPAKETIKRSLHIQQFFLEQHLNNIGYKVIYDVNYKAKPNTSFKLRLEKLSGNRETVNDTEMLKVSEKVLLLHELGILDFLRTKPPFNTSVNKLAEILHKVLGEKQTTLQSYLNPMFNENTYQDNNPLTKRKLVEKVRIALAELGFGK